MKGRTIAAWTLGTAAAAAIVAGVMFAPSLMPREDTSMVSAPPAAVEPAPAPAPKARVRRSAPAASAAAKAEEPKTIAPDHVPTLAATEPELHARLKPVLNRGAKMEIAAEGFRDAEQFATVAHAARYTEVPFMVLKHRVLNEGQSLAEAIRASKPDIDVDRQVTRARNAARFDISVITADTDATS